MAENCSGERDKEGVIVIVFNNVLERTTREAELELDRGRAATVRLEKQVVEHLKDI